MSSDAKQQWLNNALTEIRNKKLQTPIKINAAATIDNLEKYITVLYKSAMQTNNKKLLQLFVDKLNELKNYEAKNIHSR